MDVQAPTSTAPDWARLWDVVRSSLSIERHAEYFAWLQDHVREYLPHEALIAAWGDFEQCRLSYDVASTDPHICTRHVLEDVNLDPLLLQLYARWKAGSEPWYVVSNASLEGCVAQREHPFVTQLERMKSLLVYGVRDRRSGQDSLYVFFCRHADLRPEPHLMRTLLPQVDMALRRVDCMESAAARRSSAVEGMSVREREVMAWITQGKTNDEIALILGISPNTVKNHLKHIFQKLDVSKRAQAVARYEGLRRAGAASVAAGRRDAPGSALSQVG